MKIRHTGPLSIGRKVTYVLIILFAAVFIYFVAGRGMRFFMIPSRSMEPTLSPPEYVVTLSERIYARGDIVVLDDPIEGTGYLAKRIVGVAGDTVSIRGGAVYLNGLYASEPYVKNTIDYSLDQPYTVRENEVFVLGDNRNFSEDSHEWEYKGISVDSIVGRVRYVYLPFSRMREVRSYPLTNLDGL
ncbi:MAG: signal peptidase I [Candidatus Hydrogenedentes bacterium]|nr:signal peptidase I [Candidatus Hydrogenedentota bacterium]